MLTLYSFGPAANSLKPLLALYEKGLPFTPRFIDPRKFEHHEEWFKKINPRGQVPALDHDGHIITESTVICEYLEDAFPDAPRLRPADPVATAEMRVWTKWVDEYFCWCVSTIGWERMIGPMARKLSDAEFEEKMKHIPVPEQQVKWRNARAGSHHDNRCVIVLRHAKRLVRRDENPGTLPRFYPVREIGGAHAATLATFGAITHAGDCQMHAVVRGQRAGRDRIGAVL